METRSINLNPTVDQRDAKAFRRQHEDILALLRLRPRTARELNEIAFGYRQRISELRQAGYVIKAERAEGRTFRYTLVSEPDGGNDNQRQAAAAQAGEADDEVGAGALHGAGGAEGMRRNGADEHVAAESAEGVVAAPRASGGDSGTGDRIGGGGGLSDYEAFLARKFTHVAPTGFDADVSAPYLFPFQRDLVRWAVKRGRAAIFASTGLGKTRQELEYARHVVAHTGGRVLVLAPLAVAPQTVREGASIGIDVTLCREPSDVRDGINITNYDRLHKFDASKFVGVVLDECFAPGTMIDTADGARPIETIRVGDSILNAAGLDRVADIHRREVPFAVKVSYGARSCIASPNHPFFTQRGWVGAQDLRAGDYALGTAAAVRLVRNGVRSEVSNELRATILRSILLSEMADEHARAQGQGASPRGGDQEGGESFGCVQVAGRPVTGEESRKDSMPQTVDARRGEAEDLPPIESHEARTFRAWGERSWFYGAAKDLAGCSRCELDGGICFVVGPTTSGIPDALQARLGASRKETRDRGGWILSRWESQASRPEEGREVGFVRVDGIEILEHGNPELEQFRTRDGRVYFYDLGATRHPSFSVNGALVHNSSCIKHWETKTLAHLLDAFAETPFKLCASATPAPNDFAELGTHAEFLNVRSRAEMLAEFFVHDSSDTSSWRLKGHARASFWEWVASWAALVRLPSDIGGDDTGYILPSFTVRHHILPAEQSETFATGVLFPELAHGLAAQRAAKRASLSRRVAAVADLVRGNSEKWICWAELNAEQDALAEALGDECVSIYGSLDADEKEQRWEMFRTGERRVLLSKVSIFGYGVNAQFCSRMAFIGASNSYEDYHQACRRIWRFGQTRPVEVHVVLAEAERAILENLKRKEADASRMAEELSAATREAVRANVRGRTNRHHEYVSVNPTWPEWLR